tara:strand:- start:157 stop:543 length:387 start_codon:yes stop_codon:yes gene_type:complete
MSSIEEKLKAVIVHSVIYSTQGNPKLAYELLHEANSMLINSGYEFASQQTKMVAQASYFIWMEHSIQEATRAYFNGDIVTARKWSESALKNATLVDEIEDALGLGDEMIRKLTEIRIDLLREYYEVQA